ncbi:hypothetical protein ON05_020060 [Acaryochloris sp. CCMEE 5410]|nr:hypothetical protein ON05_020060 [Acaryochloris sp. CCMEE 5410]
MAGWMSIDPKVRSHLGKSLALSLLIAGVWPMAALAEEISAALPQATEPLGDIGTDPAPLEAPPSAEPEITAAYISPPSDFQLTLDSADTVPEHSLSPVPQDESITQHPEASLAAALEADQHPQPSPKDLTDQPVIEQLPPTIDTKPPITASPPRTLAEAGWTTAPQVIAINQGTTPSNSAAVTSQPLVQAEPDVPTDTTTGEQSDTPTGTETDTSTNLGIPYFVDTEFRGSTRRQFGGINLRLPFWQDDQSFAFADIHFEGGSNETFLGNLGLAYRRVLNTSNENPWILGTHAFYDSKRSENGFQYHQGSLGAELVNKKFEFRVNGYLPSGNPNVVGQRTVNGVLGIQPSANGLGTNIVQQTLTLEARERALAGFDFEAGHRHHFNDKVSLGLFGGYFFFDSSETLSIDGPMARAQLEVQDPLGMNGGLLQVGGRFRFDETRGSELEGFVRLGIPFGGPKRSQPLSLTQRLARRPIGREYEITTFAQDINRPISMTELQAATAGQGTLSPLGPQIIASDSQVALNPATGLPINIFFIDGDGTAGSGTQSSPLTIAQASALTQANDILFFLNDAGAIDTQTGTGGTLSLKEGQQALGVGTTPNFVFTVPNLGSVTIFDTGQPQLVNGANNNVLTLANNNTIDGLAFNGQNTAPRGIAAVTGATNTTIRNSSLGNFTIAGIQITPSTNTTIDNVVFNNNATDAIVNAANTTLTNVVSTNATGPAIQILNATGTTTLTNVNISNSGGDGLQFANPSGTITATNVDITNAGDNGLEITDGDGTFTFDAASSITNATNAAFNVVGGTTTITYNGTITQDNPASAVNINNKTGGTTTFNGLVTANTSTAPGVNLANNPGSTIAFNGGLDIDTTTGIGFNATNGGTVNVAATSGDESVTTTSGTALNLNNIAANITFDSVSSTGGTNGINLDTVTGSVSVSGTTTIANTTGDGFLATNSTGTYTFGPVTITNAGLDGMDLSGINDATTVFNLGALTINGFTGSGINLTGANVSVTAPTVAITNTGNVGTGIDLTNTTGNRVITLGDPANVNGDTPSSIAGVNVGVQLNNANANFTFGDGEQMTDAPSTIAATTPIDASAVGANGTYNFRDVAFTGNPGLGFTFPELFFIDQNTNGSGATLTDPGSITTAEASPTADIFILVNTSGTDVIDANNAGGTFDLTANQQILSFRNGSTINIPFAGPGNVLLNASTGLITDTTGNGAPTLTTTGAGTPATVAFANNNTINGVVLDNGRNGAAVSGTGLAGAATIQQSTLPTVDFNGGTVNVNITGSTLNNGNPLATVNVSGGHTGALTVDAATTINATNGTGLQFDNADGTYTFNGPITLNGGDAGLDILNGSGGTFTFANAAITNPTGIAYNEDTSTATVTYTGTITQNNAVSTININNKTGGTTTFNGLVTANTGTATGVNLTSNAGSTVSFTGGLDIDTTTAVGFNVTGSTVNVGALGSTGAYTVTTTDGLAVNIIDSTVDTTFNSISATRSTSGSGITLSNLDGAFAVNGGTLSSPVGSDQNSFSIIQNDVTATRNLTVAIDGISIIHDATTSIGDLDFGVFAETRDDDQLVLSIANSIFKTEDQGVVIQGITEGLIVTDFSNNTLQGDSTAFNPAFMANGFRFDGVVFDADPNTAGLQEVQGGTLTLGSPTERTSFGFTAATLDTGRSSRGTIRFDQFNANVTNAAILTNASSADLTIRILDGNVDAGQIDLNQVNSDITLSSLTLNEDGGNSGFVANQVTGSFTVTGATSITAPELSQAIGAQFFSPTATTQGISIANSSANFTFNSINIAPSTLTPPTGLVLTNGGPTVGIQLTGNAGTFTATGTTTINTTVEDGILISNNPGNVTFGTTNISNPGAPIVPTPLFTPRVIDAAGIDIEGVNNGAIAFGNTSITNFGDDTGVDFAGSDPMGGVQFTSLNIAGTGTAGSVGIDLSSTLGNRLIQVGDSMNPGADTPSSIANVEIGVELSSSQAVGTTANVNFIFGDGEDTVDQASTISVTAGGFTVQAIGLDPASGTYNFNDVSFTGNPNFTSGAGVAGQLFFVSNTGMGDGSSPTQAASVTAAQTQANLATVNTFVFINNGTTYNFDTLLAAAGNSFTLGTGDAIDGFGNGQTFGFQQPANVLGTFPSTNITDPTGNGAAVLSTSAGNNVITLANNNTIQNVIFDGSSTAARAIAGLTGANNTTIQNTTIRNFTTGIEITPSTNTTLNNVTFSGNNTDVIVNAADTMLSNITSTGTTGTSLQITNATGTTTLQNVSLAGGVVFTNAAGTVNIDNLDITNATGIGVDISGGNATFDFDTASSITNPTGTAFNLNGGTASITYSGSIAQANNASTVNVTGGHSTGTVTFQTGMLSATNGNGLQFNNADGTYNFNGTTTLNGGDAGIDILNGSAGTFTFANTTITSPTGISLNVDGGAANINYNGTSSIAQANNASAVNVQSGHTGTITFASTTNINATNGNGLQFNNADGTYNFNGTTTLNGGDAGIDILNGSAGTFTFSANTSITSPSGTAFNEDTSTASVTYAGTITQNNAASAVNINNKTGNTTAFNGLVTANTSTAPGINLTNNTGSTINFNAGLNIDTTTGTGLNATTGGTVGVAATAGDESVTTTSGQAINLNGIASNITFDTVSSTAGASGISLNTLTGSFAVTGTTNVNNPTGNAITLTSNSGTVTFGTVNIDMGTTASTSGIRYVGTNAATTFGTTTITDVGAAANQVGINFNGATLSGTAAYNAVAISGPDTSTSSIGVDLTALAGNQTVNLGTQTTPATGPSSSITDLHRGVVIDNTAAVQFTFGDGESASDTGSSINVNAQAGAFTVDAGNGTLAASSFDFEDVTFGAGDAANFPAGAASATFVSQNGGTLTAGTFGLSQSISTISVAAADLLAGTETFAFIGNIDVTAQGATGFTLATGQSITGFANTNSVSFGSIKPANILGTFSTVGGTITANSAVITNSTAGSDVLTLGGNNTIEHNTFEYSTGTANIFDIDNATAGFSNGTGITIQNNVIQNVGANATVFNVANLTTNVTAQNNTINVAGELLNANGGTGNITLTRGTGTTFSARNINVANKTGGTVAITGPLTLNSGTVNAVNLTSNTGATINFAGGTLDIDTTTGVGFNATNGGTVNVTGTANTINSGATTALNIANTTIGTSGVTFQSISANGGTNGINLNNVGSGGFNVTGDGATLGSGGLIDNSTGAGIRLSNAQNISLNFIDVTDGGNDGIFGDNVNGFTLSSGRILRNGNANGESGIQFGDTTTPLNGVSGAVSITNSLIDSSQSFGIDIRNSSGTLSSLTLTGNTISNNTQDSAFVYEGTGTSVLTTANIANNTIQNIPASAFIINVTDQGTADVVLDGNTITGTNTFGQITSNLNAVVNFDIRNHGTAGNPVLFSGTNSDGINLLLGSQSTTSGRLQGNIDNNFISLTDTNNFLGENITAIAEGNGTLTITITDNTLVNAGFQEVIRLFARDGDNTFNATVTGNAVTQSNIFGLEGIFFQSGATGSATDDINACADIGGAGALANTVSAAGGTDDIRLRLRSSTDSFVLPGFTGSGTSGVDVANYLAGRNNSTSDNITIDAGLTFSGGVSCPTPP